MSGKVLWGQATAANRTREIRPSGMRGGLTETWAMVEAKRARTAETSKPPSFDLRLRALYFYPTTSSALDVHFVNSLPLLEAGMVLKPFIFKGSELAQDL